MRFVLIPVPVINFTIAISIGLGQLPGLPDLHVPPPPWRSVKPEARGHSAVGPYTLNV